jgi:hypothetical protein
MQKKIFLILILALFSFSVYLFHCLGVESRTDLFLHRERIAVDSAGKILIHYDLAHREPLLLKIKSSVELPLSEAYFNDNLLEPQRASLRGITYSYYLGVPAKFVEPGQNKVEITMRGQSELPVDVRLSNYVKKSSDDLTFLFPDSRIFYAKKTAHTVLFAIFGFVFLVFICMTLAASANLAAGLVYRYIFYSFIPANALMALLHYYPPHMGLRAALTEGYFAVIEIFIFLLSAGIIFARHISRLKVPRFEFYKYRLPGSRGLSGILLPGTLPMVRVVSTYLPQLGFVVWFKNISLSDKIIVAFIALLLFCAVLLILSAEPAAEHVANFAFLLLAVGVAFKLVAVLRQYKKRK